MFVVLVVAAHVVAPELLYEPLSATRDGRFPALGYAAFVALLLATVGYTLAFVRGPAPLRKFLLGPLVTAALLVGVLLTPTRTTYHDGLAAAVLVWVTVFFAVRWLDVSVWVAVGWLVGVIVVTGVPVFVSPPWAQKMLVACQVVAMNIDARRVQRLTTSRRVVRRSRRDFE